MIELDFACEIAIRALRIFYNDDDVDLSVILFSASVRNYIVVQMHFAATKPCAFTEKYSTTVGTQKIFVLSHFPYRGSIVEIAFKCVITYTFSIRAKVNSSSALYPGGIRSFTLAGVGISSEMLN